MSNASKATHEFVGHADAPTTWCVIPTEGTEHGYCGQPEDAAVHGSKPAAQVTPERLAEIRARWEAPKQAESLDACLELVGECNANAYLDVCALIDAYEAQRQEIERLNARSLEVQRLDLISLSHAQAQVAELESKLSVLRAERGGLTNSAAEICAEMARESALRAAKCRSEDVTALGIIEGYEGAATALRKAEERIRARATPDKQKGGSTDEKET